ncbi:MAG: fused MFS/spermidine synthase [Sedimentisphaerales bacterium]|nr:fused MFS/spermidine synthase [Sedimentisphaerales bacterium]
MFRKIGVAVTVFGCGWILMGLEIIGGRLLAPYFGSGVWVWGSVISVFLAALSVGYFLGGLMSQRFPTGRALASIIAAAAIFLLPVALWHRSAGEWFASLDLHERWGSLLAATSLFFIPSLLLGMVSPYSVRLIARNLATVGTSAGTLYAISTTGSFLGCLLTAFYFILLMGIQHILYLSAGLLLLLAVWMFCVWQLSEKKE